MAMVATHNVEGRGEQKDMSQQSAVPFQVIGSTALVEFVLLALEDVT
jgi:hypothetical protein